MIYWATSIAALMGVWLNIQKRVASFWIWSLTNAVWAYADYTHGLHAQAVLQAVYFGLSIYGIWRWSTQDEKGNPHVTKTSAGRL